jgi:hypothetical protein
MQLVGLGADAVCEQQNIALLPRNLLGREFVTSSGGRHIEYVNGI